MHAIARDDDLWEGQHAEETKRIARVIRLTALLTAQPRQYKRAGLATRYEVSERQIARDLELLRGLGYAITSTPDGYMFENAPVLPALNLSLPEALTLALAAGLARDSGDVDTATLGAALAKLEALTPRDASALLRRDLARASASSGTAAQRAGTLALLQQARLERRRVRVIYETGSRGGARSERVIEPYHLQRYGRFWIVIAYDYLRRAVRDFKVDRIRAAALLDERYVIPEDFDLAAYRGATWGLLRGEAGAPVDVELLVTAQAGRWIQEEDRGVPLAVEQRPDGRVLIRFRAGVTDETVHWLLSFGPECRVLAPPLLAERVRSMAAETVEVYAE